MYVHSMKSDDLNRYLKYYLFIVKGINYIFFSLKKNQCCIKLRLYELIKVLLVL